MIKKDRQKNVFRTSSLIIFLLTLFLLGSFLIAPSGVISKAHAATITVSTASQLTTALSVVKPGDTITLKDGIYTGSAFTLLGKKATSTSRIVIKAANRNKAIISGNAYLHIQDSSFITIEGLLFTNTGNPSVRLTSSDHVSVRRNIFRQVENGSTTSIHWIYVRGSTAGSHVIERNLFENKVDLGNFISIAGSETAVSQNNVIRYNHFKNIDASQHNLGKEAIRIGVSNIATTNAYTTIESNLFENCSGDFEIISIKSGRNTIKNNTFRDNNGSVVLRHGNENKVFGNFFLGGQGGIRVYGKGQLIYNNYIDGTTGGGDYLGALLVPNGDVESTPAGVALDIYERPRDIVVAFNTLVNNRANLEIGGTISGTLSAQNLTIANNVITGSQGKLVNVITSPISSTWSGNFMYPTGTATLGVTMPSTAIRVVNPLLTTVNTLQKLTSKSPAINMSTGNYAYVTVDMDGQNRSGKADSGADEYSTGSIFTSPLTASSVGPNSN